MAELNFWDNLPLEMQKILNAEAQSLSFKRGDFIYRVGDRPQGLYVIEEGLVSLLILGLSGREHLLRFFREGQFFGHRSLMSEEPYHGTTKALEPTRIKWIPRQPLQKMIDQHPEMLKPIVKTLAQELRRSEIQHVMILENQILARTAQSLIYLKDLKEDHNWTRQEIADFCASTSSTVIKAMAELESRGLIQQKGREFHILDRQGLLDLADEEPR